MISQSDCPCIRVLSVSSTGGGCTDGSETLELVDDRFEVRSATGIDDAAAAFAADEFDCVVVDAQLEAGWCEALDAVRTCSADVPVFLCVGPESESIVPKALSRGITDWVRSDWGQSVVATRLINVVDAAWGRQDAVETGGIDTGSREWSLIENFPGVLYRARLGSGREFLMVEGNVESITGYSSESLRTEQCWNRDIVHPADRSRLEETIETADSSEGTFEISYRIYTQEDELRWVTERGRPIGEGCLEGVITDITERRRTENRFETLMELTPAMVAIVGSDGAFQYVNAAHAEFLGHETDELIGQNAFEYLHPDDREEIWPTFLSLVDSPDSVITVEFRFEHATDGYRWLTTHARNCLGTVGIDGIVTISQDISEQKRRERKLSEQNARLEEFSSVVSHDIRNPLNVATGRLELAREECDSEHLPAVAASLERMAQIVDDTLWLVREGREVDERTPVDLASAARSAWNHVETDDATLEVDLEWTVEADEPRLLQLFENLFRNSIDHAGEEVTVRLGCKPDTDGFYVEDDGPGVSPDERDRLFEAGYTTAQDGTGFGLRIVRDIVEAHGWEATITEESDGGFRLEIDGIDSGE